MLTMYLAMLGSETDRERFALLYEAHEKRLYAVALKILGNPVQAEDAAQQAWLQVLRNWDRVNGLEWEAAAKYLAVAAKNAALDSLKKERWTASMPEDWDAPAPEHNLGEYPSAGRTDLFYARGIPAHFGTEICGGGDQPGHRPAAGAQGVHCFHPNPAGAETAPGRYGTGGILL